MGRGKTDTARGWKRASVAWVWTLCCSALLLLGLAASYVPPSSALMLAPFGLIFPAAMIGALLGIFALLVLRRWRVLLWGALLAYFAMPALRATLGTAQAHSTAAQAAPDHAPYLKTMTWNVRLFDFYGWTDGREAPRRDEDERSGSGVKAAIFEQISQQAPDVLCLQEFYFHSDPRKYNTTDSLLSRASFADFHAVYTHHMHAQHFGVATFSRHPIIAREAIHFESDDNNVCAVTDIVRAPGDTVRIFNAHLSSLRFQVEDYQALEGHVPDAGERARLLGRLTRAYRLREDQMTMVLDAVAASPYPSMLCGDFNDTPVSFALFQARRLLGDAHDVCPLLSALSATWQGAVPGVRIDYIFHDRAWVPSKYRQGGDLLSDHRWVAVDLARL